MVEGERRIVVRGELTNPVWFFVGDHEERRRITPEFFQARDARHFSDARTAPRGPEIDEQDLVTRGTNARARPRACVRECQVEELFDIELGFLIQEPLRVVPSHLVFVVCIKAVRQDPVRHPPRAEAESQAEEEI